MAKDVRSAIYSLTPRKVPPEKTYLILSPFLSDVCNSVDGL